MAVTGKLEVQFEIQSPAIEFFHFYTKNLHNLANAASVIHEGKLHEGDDWHAIGSVKCWSYTIDGKVVTCKERIGEIDEENKSVKVELFDGDIKDNHKSFKFIMKVTDKEGGGAIAKLTFFYEKQHEGVEDPKGYLDMLTTAGKDVDAYLINAKRGE